MKNFLLCLFLIFGSIGHLHAEAFKIDQYNVVISVQEDGSFRVLETISVRFSEERHGIFRSGSVSYLH